MTLQYFVTASDTGNRIPIEVDKSTPADLAATKESWQTDWTSEFIGDPALEKYTAKTENGEIVALGAYRETESSMFVYIEYIESHPESNPTLTIQKKYLGIGRMMIAFGIQLSIDSGKNGVVTLFDPNKFDMERVRSTMGLPHLTDHQTTLGEPHIYEDINQLADWVLNGVEPYCTAEHARHVIEIIEAAYKSAEEGHVVDIKSTFEPIPLDKLGV